MKRSLIVAAVCAAFLFGLQLVADKNASAFTNVPWMLSLAILGAVLVILGGVAYRLMLGSEVAKFCLIALMVIVANGLAEIVIGSDQAYPRLGLWLIIPYVVACWLGAVLAIALAKINARERSP